MKKAFRNLFVIGLAAVMLAGSWTGNAVTAFAEEAPQEDVEPVFTAADTTIASFTHNNIGYTLSYGDVGYTLSFSCNGIPQIDSSWQTAMQIAGYSSYSIARIVIGEGFTAIAARAFAGYAPLEYAVFPNSLKGIGREAFDGCSGLCELHIPHGVTSIGDHAFRNCVSLCSASLPNTLTNVGNGIFSGITHDDFYQIRFEGTYTQFEELGIDPGPSFVSEECPLYSDVRDPSLFYYTPICWMADEGITTGFSDGTFRPLNTCNRAAVVTFLWRMSGEPDPSGTVPVKPFTDMTGNSDFDTAIRWAVGEGIVTGYSDGTFRPWNSCNRAAIVTFLWRWSDKPDSAGTAAPFSDMTENSDFDRAIRWASETGIVTGYADGTFRPWNNCNRLAVSTFLYRT